MKENFFSTPKENYYKKLHLNYPFLRIFESHPSPSEKTESANMPIPKNKIKQTSKLRPKRLPQSSGRV